MKRCMLVVFLLLSACSTVPAAHTASPSSSDNATPTPEGPGVLERATPTSLPAASEPSPTSEGPQEFPSYPSAPLQTAGPWLVIYDELSHKMVAMNADGTGPTELHLPPPIMYAEIKGGKDLFAYISGSDDFSKPELELILVELPGGDIYDRIALIEPDWHEKALPDNIEERELYQSDVMQSIVESGSFAWSPDGRYLAYIGATAGPSGDVYVYDSEERSTTRLTTGSGQAALLSWSPDSAWIAHLAVRTFCCGAGWNVEALWVADPSGESIEQVTSGGGMFFIQKWVGGQSFIMARWTAAYGLEDLFLVDIPSKDSRSFFDAPLQERAFNAPGDAIALYLDTYGAEAYGVVPGIYIQPVTGEAPILVVPRTTPLSLDYSAEAELFVAGLAQEVILFSREGEISLRVPVGGAARVSPDGASIAIYDMGENTLPGLHLFFLDGERTTQLTKLPIRDAFWGLDSRGIFTHVDGYGTVYFDVDSGEGHLVSVRFPPMQSMTWVGE